MNRKQHTLSCDILVAGGGPAGVSCALAAARQGAKVILCQDRPVLGGNSSSEVRMHMVGADALGRGAELACEAREGGIIEEIRLDCCVSNPQRSASMLDLVYYDKCRMEPNLTLLLNTSVVAAEMTDGLISRVNAARESTEDYFEIQAKVFVDCTGDGRLGVEAGAPFRRGREARMEFGEPLAQEQADEQTLGSTILFTASRHDRPMPFRAPSWVRKFTREELRLRMCPDDGNKEASHDHFGYGFWWAEWGGQIDTIKDNEVIRDELLAITLGIWDYVKNSGDYPNSENWALSWFGFLPGKRESRRFEGQYLLKESDVLGALPKEDAIAFGGWPIDTHPPSGVDAVDEEPCNHHHVPFLFDIPLRSCVSSTIPNLMFAGRNLSATHIAFASTRVMATCSVVGQGVGVSAAHAVRAGIRPAEIAADKAVMKGIQQELIKQDAYLIDVYNNDPLDHALRATITADSEQAGAAGPLVISGQSRAVDGNEGVEPGRCKPGVNRWMSAPEAGLPACLVFTWDRPVFLREIRCVFDTGMHRPLTLTHHDGLWNKMQWGQAQPETVKDYDIEVRKPGEGSWEPLFKITENYQRLRIHRLDTAIKADAMRIVVRSTNGIPEARVCEVRVY
jgi:hypothetical protein